MVKIISYVAGVLSFIKTVHFSCKKCIFWFMPNFINKKSTGQSRHKLCLKSLTLDASHLKTS